MDKENVVHIYTIDYYSAINRNEIMKFKGKGMAPRKIMLGELTQTPEEKYAVYSLVCGW